MYKKFKFPYTNSIAIARFIYDLSYAISTPIPNKPNNLIFYFPPKKLFYLNLYLDLDNLCMDAYIDITIRIFYNKS